MGRETPTLILLLFVGFVIYRSAGANSLIKRPKTDYDYKRGYGSHKEEKHNSTIRAVYIRESELYIEKHCYENGLP